MKKNNIQSPGTNKSCRSGGRKLSRSITQIIAMTILALSIAADTLGQQPSFDYYGDRKATFIRSNTDGNGKGDRDNNTSMAGSSVNEFIFFSSNPFADWHAYRYPNMMITNEKVVVGSSTKLNSGDPEKGLFKLLRYGLTNLDDPERRWWMAFNTRESGSDNAVDRLQDVDDWARFGSYLKNGKSNLFLTTGSPGNQQDALTIDGDGLVNIPRNLTVNGAARLGTSDGIAPVATNPGTSVFIGGHTYFTPSVTNNTVYMQARRADNSGNGNFIFRTSNNGTQVDAMSIANEGNVTINKDLVVTGSFTPGQLKPLKIIVPPVTGGGSQAFPLTSEGSLQSNGSPLGFRISLGATSGLSGTTLSEFQINNGQSYATALRMEALDVHSDTRISFPTARIVSVPVGGRLGIGRMSDPNTMLEVGEDDVNNTITKMIVHGGAKFNNDADVNHLTQVTINTNNRVTGAALTVGGPAYIGTWQSADNSVKAEHLSKYHLWVEKGIATEDLAIVAAPQWKDEVFRKGYKLPTLAEVEAFIKANEHLPGIPSEKEVKEKGYTLNQITPAFLEKIEHLVLYSIAQDKKLTQAEEQYNQLKATQEAQARDYQALKQDLEALKKKLNGQ